VATKRIQTGAKEPIEVLIVDRQDRPQPLTGLTDIKLKIRRVSDDKWFDWADNYFRASPGQKLIVLDPIGEGEYRLDNVDHVRGFDTSKIQNKTWDEVYRLMVVQDGGTGAGNVPQVGELHEGDWLDYINQAISANASPAEVAAALAALGLDHLIDVDAGGAPPADGTYVKQLLDGQTSIATTLATQYSLQQNWSYNPSLDEFIGQVWVESGNLTVVGVTNCSVTWYDHNEVALFTVTDAAPDARGVFLLTKAVPGFDAMRPYYAEATVTVTGYGSVEAKKGAFTVG
jgi:hypothetical protein